MNIILLLFLIIVLLIVLLDFIPQFYTWQSRIHIGRFNDAKLWNDKVLKKSIQWLKKTPTIKLTDNDRLIIIDLFKGNYKRNAIQHWQEAALILGLTEFYKGSKDSKAKSAIDSFVQVKLKNGNWVEKPTEIDGVILAYSILNLDWIDHSKNRKAYDEAYKIIVDLIGEEGTVQYRHYTADYRFVDTIGFICPFLALYGLKFDNQSAIDLSIKQIITFNENAMYKDSFIPCHTYNVKTKLPVGLFGWGRGLGWYAIGLIDTWTILPITNPSKKVLEESVISFAKMALQFQNDNGSWSWIVQDNQSRMDSSTTATLAWFFANTSTLDSIALESAIAKKNALDYLKSVTRRDGAIDFSQGDTKAIGVHSQEFDILPFTQGFALRTIALN